MASPSCLYPGAVSTISKSIIYNGINLYGQTITIVKVFEFNGKAVAEVRFLDKSIPVRHIYCKHIEKPKKENTAIRLL